VRRARLAATVLLALIAVITVSPLLAAGACEDDCSPECGDCAGCGLPAVPSAAAAWRVHLLSGELALASNSSRVPSPHRALDHVPLSSVA
jgi:hypothetical protein